MDIANILAAAAVAIVAGVGAYMLLVEPFRIQVRELELRLPGLPAAFDGYSILHLSDLHLTKLGLLERRLMEIIGSRPVDACMVTGDVTAEPRASDIFRRVCSAIEHRDPVYTVLGNSEHKPWLDTNMLVDALSFDEQVMLINSSAVIRRGNESITVVGVDDPYSRLDDAEKAFEGVDPTGFIILLTHCPSLAPEGTRRGADLVLAGHTHGGQVRIPGIGIVWTHMRRNGKLNNGLYMPGDIRRLTGFDPGDGVLFVSRGVGTSRIHIRFLCPPEVAYITLRRG